MVLTNQMGVPFPKLTRWLVIGAQLKNCRPHDLVWFAVFGPVCRAGVPWRRLVWDAVDQEPREIELQRRLQSLLLEGLRAADIDPSADAVNRVLANLYPDGSRRIPRHSLIRYLKGSIPIRQAKTSTRNNFKILVDLIGRRAAGQADSLTRELEALWSKSARSLTNELGFPLKWFSVIPKQRDRNYVSVDIIRIDSLEGDLLTASAVRIRPSTERGLHWRCTGTMHGSDALFLTFWPIESHNSRSRGSIALAKADYRNDYYVGHYTRQADHETGLVTREYGWYQQLPSFALHRVAVLDLDNTLRSDWSVRPWLRFLARRSGWTEAASCATTVDSCVGLYEHDEIDHDTLIDRCTSAYCALFRGRSEQEVADLAAVFINSHTRRALHGYVVPLLEKLRQRRVAPVIISGAPNALVTRYARLLGMDKSFGLSLRTEGGIYDGTVEDNPGVTRRKGEIVRDIAGQQREIVLAIGDSESDLALWDAAENCIVVGRAKVSRPWEPDRAFRLDPEQTTFNEIEAWIDRVIPHDPDFEN